MKAGGCSGVECDRVGRGDICPIGLYTELGLNQILFCCGAPILNPSKNLNEIFNICAR